VRMGDIVCGCQAVPAQIMDDNKRTKATDSHIASHRVHLPCPVITFINKSDVNLNHFLHF